MKRIAEIIGLVFGVTYRVASVLVALFVFCSLAWATEDATAPNLFWQELMGMLVPAIAAVLTSAISVVGYRLCKWLGAKEGMEKVAALTQKGFAKVNELNARVVNKWKEQAAASGGKLTDQQILDVTGMYMNEMKSEIPRGLAQGAISMLGDLDSYLKGIQEQGVAAAK